MSCHVTIYHSLALDREKRVFINIFTGCNFKIAMKLVKQLAWRSLLSSAIVLTTLPVQAAADVDRVVEALRQASKPETPVSNGLYSDWQVKPENITRWSKSCNGKEMSPSEFAANAAAARSLVTCVVRDVLKQEQTASGNNDTIAVQRVAAWWLTGDPAKYTSAEATPYVQKVVQAYQPVAQNSASTPVQKPVQKSTFYDRYMTAGYEAVQRKDSKTAKLYFQRALDERPQDQFASQAIRKLETAQKPTPTAETPTQPKR